MISNVSFCDKCRAKFASPQEVYYVLLQKPSQGFASLMGANTGARFSLCGSCFLKAQNAIEKYIVGGK